MSKIHPDGIRELVKLAKYWEDRTFDTEVKLEAVERERDSLKQQLAEANAACAEMRQVLEATLKVCRAAKEALHGVIGLIDESRGVVGWHLNGNEASWSEFNYPEELERVVEQLNKCLPEEEAECVGKDLLIVPKDKMESLLEWLEWVSRQPCERTSESDTTIVTCDQTEDAFEEWCWFCQARAVLRTLKPTLKRGEQRG